MTKITDKLIIFCVVFFVALAFSGCAGEAYRIKDDSVKAESVPVAPAVPAHEAPSPSPPEIKVSGKPATPPESVPPPTESVPAAPPVSDQKLPVTPPAPEGKVSDKPATPPESVPPREALEKTTENIPEGKGGIIFNFDDADIYEVIRTISELLRINYIVDPDVRGKVTIHTTRALDKKDLFPVFHQILEANGLAAVREGAVYKIISMKNVSHMPIALHSERDMDDIPPTERVIIQVIPLKFIAAQEMTKLLTPFVSNEGAIIADAGSNTLLIVDKGINILKVLKLADTFDVNLLEKVNHRFYFFKNIDAEDAAKTLKEIASSYPTSGSDKISLIAISRLNAILAIGHHAEMLDAFVSRLDVPSEDVEPRIHVYSVKNGEAAQLGSLLNTIFDKGGTVSKATPKDKATSKDFVHPNPLAIGSSKKEPEKAKQKEAVQGETSGNVSNSATGEIKITPDEVRNALIIEATPRDYKIVSGILERLDVLPRQVLIEATVAEITLGRDFEMGIEWTFKKEPWTETGSLSATIGAAGLNYAIGLTERWQATLSALEQDKRVNILSSPHVLASDNKQAKIAISTEIPVASTSYTSTTTTSDILETNIQYRDTGVILTVTPHINEGGLVTMDISQEVSEQSTDVAVAGKAYPSFYKRSINTTLTVKHGQTLVIGGLIKETESDSMAGVPWLSRIPLLRYFFGKDIKGKSKTEMIVMITPRVIINLEDVDAVTEEFKKKVSKVKERIENRGNKNNK